MRENGDAFRGNEDLFNDIYAGAYAITQKNTVGIKTIDNTIKLL